jgi:hypothetical protein
MKYNNMLVWILGLSLCWLTSCSEEEGRVKYPYSQPEMSGLEFSASDQVSANDSLYFSVNIHDPQTPLSTLEVKLTIGDEEISSQSIRTKGKDISISQMGVFIPFVAGLEENQSACLTLTAINVEGSEQTYPFDFHIKRPDIPKQLYLHFEGNTVTMIQDEENPYLYLTNAETEEEFPMEFTGKISTAESLDTSSLIWGASDNSNEAAIVSATSPGFTFDYRDWLIERITFNTQTFKLDVIGEQKDIYVKGVKLNASEGFFRANIAFTQGEDVEITGIEDIEKAYNRDFFDYNPETGKCTFLRESGQWEVYYSSAYNYIWVMRLNDTAPACFWMVGHGFTSAPVWNEDFNYGGWEVDVIARLAYVVPIGDNLYQTTLYLSNTHEWESFEIEIYSDREWSKDNGILLQEGSLTGDISGIAISESNGITSSDDFVPGYYRLTFNTSQGVGHETLNIQRIGD